MMAASRPVPAIVQPRFGSSCATGPGRPASTAVGTAIGVGGTAVGGSDGDADGVPDGDAVGVPVGGVTVGDVVGVPVGGAVGVGVGGLKAHFTRTRTRATTSPSAFWACSLYVSFVGAPNATLSAPCGARFTT